MLKKNVFLVTLGYTLFLTVVSLIRLDNLPDVGVSFGDKIFHFGAYAVFTILWYYTFLIKFKFIFYKALFSGVVLSIIFGIVIEVLQGSLTVYRSLEAFDVMANTFGALVAALVIWKTKGLRIKN